MSKKLCGARVLLGIHRQRLLTWPTALACLLLRPPGDTCGRLVVMMRRAEDLLVVMKGISAVRMRLVTWIASGTCLRLLKQISGSSNSSSSFKSITLRQGFLSSNQL